MAPAVVRRLVDEGHVRSCYSDIPNDAYHIGKTLDTKATASYRKETGKRHARIYTDGSIDSDCVTHPPSRNAKAYQAEYFQRVTKPKRAAKKLQQSE